jgi:hypothetical protein
MDSRLKNQEKLSEGAQMTIRAGWDKNPFNLMIRGGGLQDHSAVYCVPTFATRLAAISSS